MKFLSCLVALGLLCLPLAGCETSSSQTQNARFCVADLTKLMRDSQPGKDGVKVIESLQSEMQKELDAIQDKLEKNPQDKEAMETLQQTYAQAQQRIQVEGQNVANQIMDFIQSELDKYRKKNGYDMIIASDALVSFNPGIDKTTAIMAEIDKQKFEFKQLSSTAPAANAPDSSPAQPADGNK